MSYIPEVNDYVIWSKEKNVEGWVYFKCKEYITIEVFVKPKDEENYKDCPIHQNERILVLCFRDQWDSLQYIKKRESIYER